MKTKSIYILLAIFVFAIEVVIEKYFKDGFIRYYLGDVLVAVLVYLFFRGVTNVKKNVLAILVLVFTFTVEFLQLIDILEILEIKKNRYTSIVLGHTYSFYDLICYLVGVFGVYILDKYFTD